MKTTAAIPDTLKLDNAANIYPASMSKHYTSLYRMKVTLNEDIDTDILQEALETVSERIPTFRCRLRAGAFWWYLDRVDTTPAVRPLQPLKPFNIKDYDGLLYRVSAKGKRIVLDVFHALTDGNGALEFLMTLTGEYLHRKHGIGIDYNSLVLDPRDNPVYPEVEDSFKTVFSGRSGSLEKNVDAYHLPGKALPFGTVWDLRTVMPMEAVSACCRQLGCTVTELLTSAMLAALQEVHSGDPRKRKRPNLKISVPVNLRPIYNSRTVRNFSSYINLGIDISDGYLSFPDILSRVKAQKEHDLLPSELEPKIAANVELEEKFLVRSLPLFVKHPIIDIINRLHGDRYFSHTLSNIGKVNMPASMAPFIRDMDFILGRQRGNSGAASCLTCNGKLYFHITRKIGSDRFEKAFLRQIDSLGIPALSSLEILT